MTKKMARKILENLYNYAWGRDGSSDLRDEFHHFKFVFQQKFNVGSFIYKDDGTFVWSDQ